jgi:hypothetical protein
LVELFTRVFLSRMSEEIMSGSATTTLSPRAIRLTLIAASVLALFGLVAAPAQAGGYYGSYGNNYGPRYGYNGGYGYNNGCSSCGCHRCGCHRCGCGGCRPIVRYGGVYERRYVEREYIERRYPAYRRYGCCGGSRSYYGGYRGYGGYGGGYGGYRTPFPYGYGGVRGSSYGYGPADYQYGAPRPPVAVGYDGGSYGDAGGGWDPQ